MTRRDDVCDCDGCDKPCGYSGCYNCIGYCDGECCKCEKCFPASASVSLANGETVTMAELKRGDKVKTGRKFQIIILILINHIL